MQAISPFVRTTIFGGVLFLTPIVVIWLILSKAYNLAGRVLLPLTALIPESLSTRTTITAVLEVLLTALACFLAGLGGALPSLLRGQAPVFGEGDGLFPRHRLRQPRRLGCSGQRRR
jgi:uncharacterized membrane protein